MNEEELNKRVEELEQALADVKSAMIDSGHFKENSVIIISINNILENK